MGLSIRHNKSRVSIRNAIDLFTAGDNPSWRNHKAYFFLRNKSFTYTTRNSGKTSLLSRHKKECLAAVKVGFLPERERERERKERQFSLLLALAGERENVQRVYSYSSSWKQSHYEGTLTP